MKILKFFLFRDTFFKYYFKFEIKNNQLILITPWFALLYAEYAKSTFKETIWRGFYLNWGRTEIPKEGGNLFKKEINFIVEEISFRKYFIETQAMRNSWLNK